MFSLAHISDVHLAPLPWPRLRDLSLQRLLGLANWHRKRKHRHLLTVLEVVLRDIAALEPDHLAITGDLTNIGLPEEHAAALRWLARVGPPERVSVVPGNHDIYVHHLLDHGTERWRAYMASNAAGKPFVGHAPRGFPTVRRYGDVALIGVCSARPTLPLVAGGRLGATQRAALGAVLDRLGAADLCRVVMIHHPPLPGLATPLRDLGDSTEFAALLRQHGAELVLYGHNHINRIDQLGGPRRPIHIVGVASASSTGGGHDHPARWNLFRIARSGEGWRIVLSGRQITPDGRGLETVEQQELPHQSSSANTG
jgi:3',5'-cyclic AMP phosphodiesterase CpdA